MLQYWICVREWQNIDMFVLWCAEEKTNEVWLSIMYFGAKTNVNVTARRAAGTRSVYGMFALVYTGPDKRVFDYSLYFL